MKANTDSAMKPKQFQAGLESRSASPESPNRVPAHPLQYSGSIQLWGLLWGRQLKPLAVAFRIERKGEQSPG
jgi:hypothetical protein